MPAKLSGAYEEGLRGGEDDLRDHALMFSGLGLRRSVSAPLQPELDLIRLCNPYGTLLNKISCNSFVQSY